MNGSRYLARHPIMSFKPLRAFWFKVVVLLAVIIGWQLGVRWWRPVIEEVACVECSVGVPGLLSVSHSTKAKAMIITSASLAAAMPVRSRASGPLAAWSVRYFEARADDKERLEAEGLQLAEAQRMRMAGLILSDPQRAL